MVGGRRLYKKSKNKKTEITGKKAQPVIQKKEEKEKKITPEEVTDNVIKLNTEKDVTEAERKRPLNFNHLIYSK